MPQSTPPVHPPLTRQQWLIVSLVGVVAVVAFVVAWLTPEKKATPLTIHPKNAVALTPQSYRSFLGTVDHVATPTVVVKHVVVRGLTTQAVQLVTVTAGPTTSIESVGLVNNKESRHPLALADLKPGDKVKIGSDTNIATLTTLTATTINRIDY